MQEKKAPLKRKKRKKKSGLGYLVLFALVFILALLGLSHLVKSLSPDVDVAIGNNQSITLSDADMDVEIKTVDERLKWIQMEDEMPTVSIRNPKENTNKKDSEQEQKKDTKTDIKKKEKQKKEKEESQEKLTAPRPTASDLKQKLDFRLRSSAPLPDEQPVKINQTSKVYIGNFYTIEDAMKTQHKIAAEESDIIPFIKSINGYYVVQIGSFADVEKARALSGKMKTKGYNTKIVTEK